MNVISDFMVRPWYWPKNGMPERAEPFNWIIKDRIAISWWPDPYVVDIFRKEGIKVIVNCSEFDNREDIPKDFNYYHINIPDYGIPTKDQLKKFFEITNESGNNKHPIVVHCVGGCGRSGIMVMAWAAYNGIIPKGIDPLKWISKLRPCCSEKNTKEQIKFARKIARKYQK